ncbi:MAG TPA: hypothetical protein VMA37_10600 [Acetobacteraceae bacterium]|nr:hypothetical protein [Acetobacteraceae bacterium]
MTGSGTGERWRTHPAPEVPPEIAGKAEEKIRIGNKSAIPAILRKPKNKGRGGLTFSLSP